MGAGTGRNTESTLFPTDESMYCELTGSRGSSATLLLATADDFGLMQEQVPNKRGLHYLSVLLTDRMPARPQPGIPDGHCMTPPPSAKPRRFGG
jgi:hypothetical protein